MRKEEGPKRGLRLTNYRTKTTIAIASVQIRLQ